MTAQAIVFVVRYSDPGPIVDEWEFIPALTDEEPFWPWLWKLHNEHRFPLPRLIYYPLFKITGDFRAGCYVSIAGVALCALLMISTAKRLRGRLHFADAFFPVSLLHAGHWENLRMGYQIAFMMNLALAAVLLRVILLTSRDNMPGRGIQAGVLTLLLLGCGAGGLAYGPFIGLWLLALAFWFRGPVPVLAKSALVILAALIPIYIGIYLIGYQRPHHHADPLEVWGDLPTAGWQAFRSALQALSMSFGPAASGLWPVSALLICLIGLGCGIILGRMAASRYEERPRASGLLLYFGALALMALGIGWGRCVFLTDDGELGFMGHSSRYGWIAWPALGATYFMAIIYGGEWSSRWVPSAIFVIVMAMLPFNIGTGIVTAEAYQEYNIAWEKSVRAGLSEEELIEKYYLHHPDDIKERMRLGVYLLRKHRVQFYQPLPKNHSNGRQDSRGQPD